MQVYVTGIGTISAIGRDTTDSLNSLLSVRSGVSSVELVATQYLDDFVVGEVKSDDQSLTEMAGLSDKGLTRTTLLGYLAAKEACECAEILHQKKVKTGFISASTIGGKGKTEKYYGDFLAGKSSENIIDSYDNGDSTEFIATTLGIDGFLTTINTACASSANAIVLGARMIEHQRMDRVIVGGTDALCRFTINGFHSLMLLDQQPCKPFDQERKGINLGEGAAYLILESERLVQKQHKVPIAKISGYGATNDAYHTTASSPDGKGIQQAIRESLSGSNLNPQDIDYINVHGTGTANNDLTEGIALKQVFGDSVPCFSSTKPFTGHTLGAAGSIEAVLSILSLQQGFVPPNLNFSIPIHEHGLTPTKALQKSNSLKHVLSNSIGMGGACCSIILSKV